MRKFMIIALAGFTCQLELDWFKHKGIMALKSFRWTSIHSLLGGCYGRAKGFVHTSSCYVK